MLVWRFLSYKILGHSVLNWVIFLALVGFVVWLALGLPSDHCGIACQLGEDARGG